MKRLFRSRKVMVALLGVIQTLVLHYLNVPAEVWAAIDGLLLSVIAGITVEDAAAKRAGNGPPPPPNVAQ